MFTIKSFDQILKDWIAWTVAKAPQITDMTPGSVIRSFCEAGSLAMEELYVAVYLGFQRYLNNVQETVFDFHKKEGTRAIVEIVFSRSITSESVVIPEGVRLKTNTGLRFTTIESGQLNSGETSSSLIKAEAENVGAAYNVMNSSVTILEDSVPSIETVTNPSAASGGVDSESNLAYKNRFQTYIEGLGRSNIAGLSAGALSVEGITSVSVIELFPPVSNVNVEIYVDDGSSNGISTDKLHEVQKVIDGDGTEAYPGYRSAGINAVVKKPGVQTQNIEIMVTLIQNTDTDQMNTAITLAITNYVNTLGVGKNIIYNELISAVMSIYGVLDCDIIQPNANVVVPEFQVGRVGDISIIWV